MPKLPHFSPVLSTLNRLPHPTRWLPLAIPFFDSLSDLRPGRAPIRLFSDPARTDADPLAFLVTDSFPDPGPVLRWPLRAQLSALRLFNCPQHQPRQFQ